MQIIPVVDLSNGAVVAARMGRRSEYAPLVSPLSDSDRLETVVAALLELYPFETLYLADLDAIRGTGNHLELLNQLHLSHPQLEMWVDNGLANLDQLCLFARPVIGSESLDSVEQCLELITRLPNPVLSLDFRDQHFQGPKQLEREPSFWPRDVIAMTISRVGSGAGPDVPLCQSLLEKSPDTRVFAAGGVRDTNDLQMLRDLGAAGALVSTALHQGQIGPGAIDTLSMP